ncbi:hypothetical protein, partial [Bartonella sp. CL50QHWL]|uniref:hypothetical protein n=1 Tax=Bartonella sp. CL50QHWL TaxID=3243536 RepID=UPI0035CF6D11
LSFNHSSTYRIGSPPPLKVDKTALKYSPRGKNFKEAISIEQTFLNKKYSLQSSPKHSPRNIKIKRLPMHILPTP